MKTLSITRFDMILAKENKTLFSVYIRAKVIYKFYSEDYLNDDGFKESTLLPMLRARRETAKDILTDFFESYRREQRSDRKCPISY